jgi:hypothetical protein
VESSCERGYEPSGCITLRGSSEVAAKLAASREGLNSMELIMSFYNSRQEIM